ncbi:MAG: protein kinase [Pirellulales bacterium]|nr:protein kinase [Pirellulales bacterium]
MAQPRRYAVGDTPVPGYCLLEFLGQGNFGEVWKATAPGQTEVALKLIDLTGQAGLREFAALEKMRRIRHTNLIPLHAYWILDEDGHVLDVESLRGPATAVTSSRPVTLVIAMGLGSKSLFDRLAECRADDNLGIPHSELLRYMEDAARALDYLNRPYHDLGEGPVAIIHGDVKPQNILIVGDGAAVCDFGLARAVDSLRKTTATPVTVAYAAPEALNGKPGPFTDQYCLALSYVELRTGELPFDSALSLLGVINVHREGTLDRPGTTRSNWSCSASAASASRLARDPP